MHRLFHYIETILEEYFFTIALTWVAYTLWRTLKDKSYWRIDLFLELKCSYLGRNSP